MAGNSSGPVPLSQLGTWRSGDESPAFPGSGDARRLLEAVGRTPYGPGCTLVRVRLGDSDRRTLVRVRERLLGEESIVGTSIGRDAGPDDAGAFDILVVPDCDPVTVGREIADVDDVVGVAATAFERPDRPEGQPDDESRRADATVVDRSVVDAAVAELEAANGDASLVELADDIGRARGGRDGGVGLPDSVDVTDGDSGTATPSVPTTADVGGLDALEETDAGPADGGTVTAGPDDGGARDAEPVDWSRPPDGTGTVSELPLSPGRERSNGGGGTGRIRRSDANAGLGTGRGGTDRSARGQVGRDAPAGRPTEDRRSEFVDRLERLEERVAKLEATIGDGRRGRALDQPDAGAQSPLEEVAERLASIEATVGKLEGWRREVEASPDDESAGTG